MKINRTIPLLALTALPIVAVASAPAQASCLATSSTCSFSFEGTSQGGTGSGTLIFNGLGTTDVTVTIENTSPLTYGNPETFNYATILGVGFDAIDPNPTITDWTLEAKNSNGNTVTLGTKDGISNSWDLIEDGQVSGIKLDYIADNGSGNKNGLYNPDGLNNSAWIDDIGNNANPFFTTATLSLEFDSSFNLLLNTLTPAQCSEQSGSPLLRMQRVGNGGSLKLCATDTTLPEDPDEPLSTPEPSTLGSLAVVFGLMGISGLRRRRLKK